MEQCLIFSFCFIFVEFMNRLWCGILFFFVVLIACAVDPFRFAFLTDTHIDVGRSQPSMDLQQVVMDINRNEAVDFVLVGGDISERGDSESLQVAKQLLNQLTVPYYITSGNHDVVWGRQAAYRFKSVFEDDKFSFHHNGFHFVGLATLPGAIGKAAELSETDFRWLKRELKKAGRKRPLIFITHYPLQAGDMVHHKPLVRLLRMYNVQMVINGPYHRNVLFQYDGIPGVVCRSVLSSGNKVPGYTIFTIGDDVEVSEKEVGDEQEIWLSLPIKK